MQYRKVNSRVWKVILSEGALQLINGALMLILLLYLKSKGYSDSDNSIFFACRFLGVLFFSLPFGLYIRKQKLAKYFKASSIAMPLLTFLAIFFIEQKLDWGIYLSFILWGLAFSLAEICKIPFIMRNADDSSLSESITLGYATWSFGAVFSGIVIFGLSSISPVFDERLCLIIITCISLLGIFYAFGIKNEAPPQITSENNLESKITSEDKKLLWFALTPPLILAIGAGMSVPFIPLFFEHVFNITTKSFAGYGSIAYGLVFTLMIFAPNIKNKLGFATAVPLTQTLSVTCLVTLALSQFYSDYSGVIYVALAAYILRQPLMNIAQPLTTEVIMKYVGKRNHEIASSMMALIWNGSFVFSSLIFGGLRSLNVQYAYIFLTTATLYGIAILWFQQLIKRTDNLD